MMEIFIQKTGIVHLLAKSKSNLTLEVFISLAQGSSVNLGSINYSSYVYIDRCSLYTMFMQFAWLHISSRNVRYLQTHLEFLYHWMNDQKCIICVKLCNRRITFCHFISSALSWSHWFWSVLQHLEIFFLHRIGLFVAAMRVLRNLKFVNHL